MNYPDNVREADATVAEVACTKDTINESRCARAGVANASGSTRGQMDDWLIAIATIHCWKVVCGCVENTNFRLSNYYQFFIIFLNILNFNNKIDSFIKF